MDHDDVNIPSILAEVTAAFMQYEDALVNNKVDVLDALFWPSAYTIRYGATENLLGIGSQDQIDVVRARAKVFERGFNSVGLVDRKVHSARTPALMMVLFHSQADSAVVHNRDHLAQMLRKQPEKQHLIAVVKRGEINVFTQRIRQPLVLDIGGSDLRFERANDRRKQPAEAQALSFLSGESRALIQEWRSEYRHSPLGSHVTARSLRTVLT